MQLDVPLQTNQIKAAGRLYSGLRQSQMSDAALERLADRCPGFDREESLLKVVAINGLYGTNLYALVRMAEHIFQTLQDTNLDLSSPELVEQIAALTNPDGKTIRHTSFASKFAHFFLSADDFPIMDKYAVQMVKRHLGNRNNVKVQKGKYLEFVTNIKRLMDLSELECTPRELDQYLWLAGLYQEWKKSSESKINREAATLFANESWQVDIQLMVESPPSPDDDLIRDYIKTEKEGDKLRIFVCKVTWDGPHTSISTWKEVRVLDVNASREQIDKAVKSVLNNKRFFRICTECSERNAEGHMWADNICHSCATKNHGVVY